MLKVVYDPQQIQSLPSGNELTNVASVVSGAVGVEFVAVGEGPLPPEPFYFLVDINHVADSTFRGLCIETDNSPSIQALINFPIPSDVLYRVAQGTALIWLSRPYHGYSQDIMRLIVSTIAEQYKHTATLTPAHFVFMLPASGKNFVPDLNIVDFTFFERMVGEYRSKDHSNKVWWQRRLMIDQGILPRHRFVCTNRRSNPIRLACAVKLFQYKHLGLLTLLETPSEDNERVMCEYFPELVTDYREVVKNNLPLIWDAPYHENLSATDFIAPDTDDFLADMLDSALCIVNETFMLDQPPQWHSEKTYKAISLMMPFVIIGQRHSLRALREQGYQTFGPWINESYDTIEDERDRLRTAIREATRIIEMPDSAIAELLKNIQPALIHNFQLFNQRVKQFDTRAVEQLQEVLDNLTVDKP